MIEHIIAMQKKFNLLYEGAPRKLDRAEFDFRLNAFHEEIQEYRDAYFADNLAEQFDALIDLIIFAVGAGLQHGFPMEEGIRRVMEANMFKELVENKTESKRGYSFDLKKPGGWRPPYLRDLVTEHKAKGLIILDGPDACGKTTLADYLEKIYGALVLHSTWSNDIEKRMDKYMLQTMGIATEVSKNQLVVLDRLWLSEVIYAEVYRNGSIREDLHLSLEFLTRAANGKVIYCLPHNKLDIINNFNRMKDKRDEMYSDMSKVSSLYDDLWHGDISCFKTKTEYLKKVESKGGFCQYPNYFRYDWTTDGKNIYSFIHSINAVIQK